MKQKKWIALILVLCLLIPSLAYATHYAHWGRRHAILWDVSKIRVVRDEDDDSSVILIYDYSVKNWPHDFRKHDYYLVSNLTGEPCIWDFNVISNNKKVPNSFYFSSLHTPMKASFAVHFDLASVIPWDGVETVGDVIAYAIEIGRFLPIRIEDGEMNPWECATLYVEDSPNAEIIYELDKSYMNRNFVEFQKELKE